MVVTIITPSASIDSSVTGAYTKSFTLELEADTAKTLVDTDFGAITTSTKSYAIVLDQLRGTYVTVNMYQTASADAVTATEANTPFGPTMKNSAANRLYPIPVPFQHDFNDGHLTFRADKDCTIIGRILALT